MSDTVLGARWVVYYGAENRQKRIVRDTAVSPTTTDTVNALYSALQDLFDELNQMDDGVPMSAQTPTEYSIGIIDAGDKDPWFIDRQSVEYLTGGALKTLSWDRVTGTNTGIVKVVCNNTDIVAGDIGLDITLTGGNVGTLLDVKGTGAGSILWIRPDNNTATHDFDDAGTLTCNAHTATWTSVSSAGESLWANIYSIGTIESNTHIYIYQNNASLVAYKGTTDWWGDGHIDILVNVKELGTETDEGVIKVFARQYSKTYSYYTVDLTAGGRNPIPLQTGNDLDNQSGYWQMDMATSSGTFVDGEVIRDDSDTTIQGVVTSWNGTDKIIEYYLIGDPQSNFGAGTGAFTGLTSTATGTAVAPTAVGPSALGTPPTITFGGRATGGTDDITEDGTAENYSIAIDCNQNRLDKVYEYCKYVTRRTHTADIDAGSQTIVGESYVGSDTRIIYNALTGSIADGATVTQVTSGFTGKVVNHNTTDKIIILRDSRGTFNQTNDIQVDGSNYVTITGSTPVVAITPISSAPFGTFAGGKFFCAPGVVLTDTHSADLNNFQLVDDNGTVRVAPTKVNINVANTLGSATTGDRIAVFRLTGAGGDIDKARYNATVQSAGATTAVMGTSIAADEPGKSSGGILRLVDTSANTEYRLRFSSWTSSTFTLASSTGLTADAGSNTTTIVDSGVFTNSLVGDLIRGVSPAAISYITAKTDNNTVTISPAIAGFTTGSTYEINTLPVATTTSPQDTWYVPFLDLKCTAGGTQTVQVVYLADVPIRVRARRKEATAILPFEQDATISSTGVTVSVIRTADTIAT